MSVERPPKDASVENLIELCEVLREGEKTLDELFETVDQGNTLIRDNIRYGVGLGFIVETEDGVKTTSRGVEASYNQEHPEDLAELFQDGLRDFRLYNTALGELATEDRSTDESPITKSDVLRVFRTSLDLEGSEKTLGSAATTFINTLEAAGLGEYIVGRGGHETRLEIAERFELLVEQITDDSESEQESDEVKSESQIQPAVAEASNSMGEVDNLLQINLELSGDEDPTEIEELIVGIRRGLSRDLDLDNSESNEEGVNHENSGDYETNSEDELDDSDDSEDESETDSSDQSLDSFVDSESADEEE